MKQPHTVVAAAGAQFRDIVSRIDSEQLTRPTPCPAYDLRGLLKHLLYWGARLDAAGRRAQQPPDDVGEGAADLVQGDWRVRLDRQSASLIATFEQPARWQDMTTMVGELPASMVGRMVLCEFVLHGWDLANAAGVAHQCPVDVAEVMQRVLEDMAAQGRRMGAFGEAIEVAVSASIFDKALALSGRDPAWVG